MKAILLAVCAALIAYLVLFRQPADTVVEQAPSVASSPVSNTQPAAPAPTADSQAPASLEQEIAAFSQTANTLPAAERRQVAERLINELKTAVSNGEDLKSAYAQVERLTPNIESDPKSLESLNYSIWMDMKDHATPPAPPRLPSASNWIPTSRRRTKRLTKCSRPSMATRHDAPPSRKSSRRCAWRSSAAVPRSR